MNTSEAMLISGSNKRSEARMISGTKDGVEPVVELAARY
jgi:hypothetical protein